MFRRTEASDFFCVATVLPLRSWKHVLPFFLLTYRVRRQLRASPGLVRYRLKAAWLEKRFWTVSVWRSKPDADAFVRSGPHAFAVKQFQEWAAPGAAFVEWHSSKPRVAWREALERLSTPTFTYGAE